MAASSLRTGLYGSHNEVVLERRERAVGSLQWKNDEFKGVQVSQQQSSYNQRATIHAQGSICVPKSMRWWDDSNTSKSNMTEIHSARELVDSLLNAGDNLVVLDFYSPGCGGCKALHPKICQLAESNPDAMFLKLNYEELKPLCQSLNIHVLPFFRLYRGAQGRVCSFSCTNATINKFRDALAKHGAERCSLGPAKGLDESELLSLASNSSLQFSYPSSMEREFAHAGMFASGFSETTTTTSERVAELAMP